MKIFLPDFYRFKTNPDGKHIIFPAFFVLKKNNNNKITKAYKSFNLMQNYSEKQKFYSFILS